MQIFGPSIQREKAAIAQKYGMSSWGESVSRWFSAAGLDECFLADGIGFIQDA